MAASGRKPARGVEAIHLDVLVRVARTRPRRAPARPPVARAAAVPRPRGHASGQHDGWDVAARLGAGAGTVLSPHFPLLRPSLTIIVVVVSLPAGAQALLKIVKHCREATPEIVWGGVLGMEAGGVLEVTDCLPSVSRGDGVSEVEEERLRAELSKFHREAHGDMNEVGWYQSTSFNMHDMNEFLTTQVNFFEVLGPNAVVILFDPSATISGTLSIKAFRLTPAFVETTVDKYALETLSGAPLTSGDIFEEVPIKFRSLAPMSALLLDSVVALSSKSVAGDGTIAPAAAGGAGSGAGGGASTAASSTSSLLALAADPSKFADADFDRLDLSASGTLERYLELLITQVPLLTQSLQRESLETERKLYALKKQREEWIAKREEENKRRDDLGLDPLPLEDPSEAMFKTDVRSSRLESLVVAAQVSTFCHEINAYAGQTLTKLFLAGSLHK